MIQWGEIINGEKCYPCHQGQKKTLMSKARYIAMICGVSGGKSALGPLWLGNEIRKYPCEEWLLIAPTYKMLRNAAAKRLIETFEGTDLKGKPREDRYYLPDGGVIYYISADDYLSIQAIHVKGCWADEAGMYDDRAWEAIRARIGLKKGRCLITSTPYFDNWLKTEIFDRYMKGNKQYEVINFSSIMNPTYDIEEYNTRKIEMSQHRFDMVYNGLFTRPEGLVYPNFESCVIPHIDPPVGKHYGAIDWGFAGDPFVAICAVNYIDDKGNDIIYVYGERYKRDVLIQDHITFLPKDNIMYFYDPSNAEGAGQFRKAGFDIRKGKNDIIPGIDAVTRRINTRTLLISDRCKAMIAESKQYFHKKKDNYSGDTNKPQFKGLDHAMDTLKYLIFTLDRRR